METKLRFIYTAVISAALALPCQGQGLPMYTATLVPSPVPGMNAAIVHISADGKTMVGHVGDSSGPAGPLQSPLTQCFVTRNGQTTIYPTPGYSCQVTAANDNGQFTGNLMPSSGNARLIAFVNLDGTFDIFGSRLPGLAVTAQSTTTAININGDVVGSANGVSSDGSGGGLVSYTFLYSKGQLKQLTLEEAFAINDNGEIAGAIDAGPSGFVQGVFFHAATLINGQVTDITPTASAANAFAVNNNGVVGGTFGGKADPSNPQAPTSFPFLYMNGTMTPVLLPGSLGGNVASINNNGEAVGYYVSGGSGPNTSQQTYAFYYANGVAVDLNTLVSNLPAGVTLNTAINIADNGRIQVGGVKNGAFAGVYVLTPGNPASGAALTLTTSHVGNFLQGQNGAAYTILVQNSGTAATSSAVSVAYTLAAGLNATAIGGSGWACVLGTLTCSRSDTLAGGGTYPPITVSVSVASNAASPLVTRATMSAPGVGNASATDSTNIMPAFTDVLPTDSFLPSIDLLLQYGITSGCGTNPPAYCSGDNITEGQMAVFIVRSVMGGDSFNFTQTPYFTDVPSTHMYFPWIQKMQDLGIAVSCGPNQFCPETPVTRRIMAVLIIRARYGIATPVNYPQTPYFTDAGTTDPDFPWIQKMMQLGITSGCGVATYCPDAPVTRGEMAVFIMRGEFNELLPVTTPIVAWASVSNASPGQTVSVTILGEGTNFANGMSQVSAGPGITVGNVSVLSGTELTAQFTVAPGAALGPRSIIVTTGAEEATLPNGLRVH